MFRYCPTFFLLAISIGFTIYTYDSHPEGLKSNAYLRKYDNETKKVQYLLSAGSIAGFQGNFVEAFDDVKIMGDGKTLKSDYLRYSFSSSDVYAKGNVKLESDGLEISGDSLDFNMQSSKGVIYKPQYFLEEQNARGTADKIFADSDSEFVVENGTYTTCEADSDDWHLRINNLAIDTVKDLGVAKNAVVVFKNTPILYAPYLDFSLTGRRKSGLLAPSAGQTGQSGTEFKIPYYWNIAPHMDATITPRMMSRRGFQLSQEFRYLAEGFNSKIQTEYLSSDELYKDSRWAYSVFQKYVFGKNLSGNLSLQSVSDDDYFTDLSDNINATSLTNLPREVGLNYDGGWYNAEARIQTFRTLQDPGDFVVPPYERIPQVRFFGIRKTRIGPDIEVRGELVDFEHRTLIKARRDVFYPSLKWPLRRSFLYLTPKIGYHYTRYTFDDSAPDTQRTLPIYSLDSGVTFERTSTIFNSEYVQTLEPRLYYVYIPYREQGHIPTFDTAESDFSLAQIFTENLFTGADRINDANQLTAAVSSRFLRPKNGVEKLRVTLAQRYYFSDQRVSLDSSYVPRTSNKSDLLIGVNGELNQNLRTNVITQYSLVEDQWERSSAMLYYNPDRGKLMNVGYRFTRDSVEQLDWAMQWPVGRDWSALARWNYSTRDKQLIEGVIGLERDSGCWKTRLVAHRFASATDEYSTSFFLQLELTGLSKLGLNPIDVLKQNIRGYGKK